MEQAETISSVFIISFIVIGFVYAVIACTSTLFYRDKDFTELSLLEIKMLNGTATFSDKLKLLIINFLSSVFAPPIYILSIVATIIVWLVIRDVSTFVGSNYIIGGLIGFALMYVIQFILGFIVPIILLPVTIIFNLIEKKITTGRILMYNTFRFDHFLNFIGIGITAIFFADYILKLLPWNLNLNVLSIILIVFIDIFSYNKQKGFWYEISIIIGKIIGLLIGFLFILNTNKPLEQIVKTSETIDDTKPSTEYRINNEIELMKEKNGINGAVQVLIDNSLPKNISSALEVPEPVEKIPENAILRIINESNELIWQDTLERFLAWIDTSIVLSNAPEWKALTVDYSINFGSYNGPITSFFRVINSDLEWMTSYDRLTGKYEQIYLMQSLKTTWQISQTDGTTIYKKACRPNFDNDSVAFNIIYFQYLLNGNTWEKESYIKEGYWESDYSKKINLETEFTLSKNSDTQVL